MKKLRVGNLEISNLCLGGAQLGKLGVKEGKELVEKAKKIGINVFDAHHRYENCEEILGNCNDIIKMTKISAYKIADADELISSSKKKLGKIDIMWVSDLDNESLYKSGEVLYEKLVEEFPVIGITTESYLLFWKFMCDHPECSLFMVPVYLGIEIQMAGMIKIAQNRGKKVFAIKTFCDGSILKRYGMERCIDYVKDVAPDVIVLGTADKVHLEELVRLYGGSV